MGTDISLYAIGRISDADLERAETLVGQHDTGFGSPHDGHYLVRGNAYELTDMGWPADSDRVDYYNLLRWPGTITPVAREAIDLLRRALPRCTVVYVPSHADEYDPDLPEWSRAQLIEGVNLWSPLQ